MLFSSQRGTVTLAPAWERGWGVLIGSKPLVPPPGSAPSHEISPSPMAQDPGGRSNVFAFPSRAKKGREEMSTNLAWGAVLFVLGAWGNNKSIFPRRDRLTWKLRLARSYRGRRLGLQPKVPRKKGVVSFSRNNATACPLNAFAMAVWLLVSTQSGDLLFLRATQTVRVLHAAKPQRSQSLEGR